MCPPDAVDHSISTRFDSYLEDLQRLVSHPSISATGEGVRDCAELLESLCLEYGFDTTEIVETSGQPAVIAHAYVDGNPATEAPTVLMYGHYDVQPVEDSAWETDPFEPVVREQDGEAFLYGRGTVDNKGQHFAHLCAVQSLRETTGLPTHVTLFLDGEEESGSPHIEEAVRPRVDELTADVSINADGPVHDSGRPTVVLGNRGILLVDIEVRGPKGDLHSGHYGGAVPNPAWELLHLLETMRDGDGRITIDGFYDDVRPITASDRELLEAVEPDPEALVGHLDIGGLQGGPGESFLEQTLYYPSLNINGLESGHIGDGFKTIVPSKASVTIDARLAADQDPDDVYDRIVAHVEDHASDLVSVSISRGPSMDPLRTPADSPYVQPVVAAVTDGWGVDPIVKPASGGSAPYAVFANVLDIPHLTVPYGQPDNNQHSPNEHLSLEHFKRGIHTTTRLLETVRDVHEGSDAL